MLLAAILLKTIKVAACLAVMGFFSVIVMLAIKRDALIAERILGVVSLIIVVVFAYVMATVIRAPNYLRSWSSLADLEKEGMVTTTDYKASRAIKVEEFGDEGMYYLLDIGGGRTMCLSGQDLYEFESFEDEESGNRRFPNTRFQIKRHMKHGYSLGMVPVGVPFEPQYVFEHFSGEEFGKNVMEDGRIVHSPLLTN